MRRQMGAVLAVGMLAGLAATVMTGPPGSATTQHAARFAAYTDHTAAVVDPATTQRVTAAVRVLDAVTGAPARGTIWLVAADGYRESAKVTLKPTGWGVVSADPPPGLLPGSYVWHVRYSGSAKVLGATSVAGTAFRVAQPAADPTVDDSFIASPDVTNEDIADLSGLPGYDPAYGNSWNQWTADSVDWVYDEIAARNPSAFLISGDLVEGRWGLPDNHSGLFGSSTEGGWPITEDQQVAMVQQQAALYNGANAQRLKDAGLYDRTLPAVGDHDIGDNWWYDSSAYGAFKLHHLDLWRDSFHDNYLVKSGGGAKGFTRPVGTQWEKTAYATMVNPDLLVVTLDEFNQRDHGVSVTVTGGQLTWLEGVLAHARHTGVRWIVLQGHVPILPSAVWHSSGLHINGGTDSPLWKLMVKYRVNLYIAGEVHTTSRYTQDGITQITTGSPIPAGETTFLDVQVFHDRLAMGLWGWYVDDHKSTPQYLWNGGCSITENELPAEERPAYCSGWSHNSGGNKDYVGIEPTDMAQLTVRLDGTADPGTGSLVQYAGGSGSSH
ncbi:metallophosphoesterase family protein [Nocardioides ultimimeridianus]